MALPASKIERSLERYISSLDSFFSLNDEVDGKALKKSGQELSKCYEEFKDECFDQRMDQVALSNEKVREEIKVLLPLAERIKNIKQVNVYEKQLINSTQLYVMSRINFFGKSFQQVFKKALNDSDVSHLLEKLVKSQRNKKYYIALSFASIPLALLGLVPILSIPAAAISIFLVFWEMKMSDSKMKKLKELGREVKAKGLSDISKITESVNQLVEFNKYIAGIEPDLLPEVDDALSKLENNERLKIPVITDLTASIAEKMNVMAARFEIQ